MSEDTAPFLLRDYEKKDFDAIFKLDRLCFEPGVAYSRPELSSFIEQRRSFTIVAEFPPEPALQISTTDDLPWKPPPRPSATRPDSARPTPRSADTSPDSSPITCRSGVRPHHHPGRASRGAPPATGFAADGSRLRAPA